jgi:hypothetical protein
VPPSFEKNLKETAHLRQEDIGRISLLETQFQTLNDQLDTRLSTLNAKFETLIDVISGSQQPKKTKVSGKGRGRGRGKNSLNSPQPDCDGGQYFGYDGSMPGTSRQLSQPHSTRSSDIFTEDESIQRSLSLRNEPIRRVGAEKRVHITKIQCLLNNAPIDMVEDFQTEDECMQAYWRLFTFNSQMNSLFTNSISYDEFR